MKCCLVQEMLSAYLDRQLTGQETLDVEAHLCRCAACSEELAELRQVKYLLRSLGGRHAAPELGETIAARLERNRPETLTPPAPLLRGRSLALALSCLAVFAAAPFSPAVLEFSHVENAEHARSVDFLMRESGLTPMPPLMSSLASFPSQTRFHDDGDGRYARPYAQPGTAGLDGDPMDEPAANGYASGDVTLVAAPAR